jgi:hypothetical protein
LKKRLFLLVGSCLLLWFLLAGPVFVGLGEQQLLFSAVAAGICLLPAAATMFWCELSVGKTPEAQFAVALGGTAVRMVFVVGLGMLLYFGLSGFRSAGFWLWVIGYYLVTLVIEVVLLARRPVHEHGASTVAMDLDVQRTGNGR